MKVHILVAFGLFFTSTANCDTTVILPDNRLFADNDPNFHVETTIPGDFETPEGIMWALFTLGDQAANSALSNPFTPSSIISTSGGEGAEPLANYFRGAKIENKRMKLYFTKDAMRYLNNTVSIQASVKGSIVGTILKNFPKVSGVEYIVEGKVITDWDA